MVKTELIKRSPLRILESSTRGGVGKGNIGIIAARKGVGKTAFLVHLATDQLLQGKHVIHVSFSLETSHIVTWYEDIFEEIARRYKLDGAMDVHDDIIRNRVILNFKQDSVSAQQVEKSLIAIIKEGNFSADVVVIDGYDFSKSSDTEFSSFKKLAEELNIQIWLSATVRREEQTTTEQGIPLLLAPFISNVAILITLDPCEDYIHLNLVKDHDGAPNSNLHLKLDPQILLIVEKN